MDPNIISNISPELLVAGAGAIAVAGVGIGVGLIEAASKAREFIVITNENGVEGHRVTRAESRDDAAKQHLARGRYVVHVEEASRNAQRGRR